MLSYQSARSGWKIILAGAVFATAVAEARPYRDDRRGFALELLDGWSLAPRFGETEAMVFERQFSGRRGHRRGTLSVRPIADDIADDQVQVELQRVWGVSHGAVQPLGSLPAGIRTRWSRRYRPDRPGWGEAHALETAGPRRFLVTLEAAPRDRRRFRNDAGVFLSTFRPLAVRKTAKARSSDVEASTRVKRSPRGEAGFVDVTGQWVRPDGATLALEPGGRYVLADVSGGYRWQNGQLILTRADGSLQSFTVELRGDRLILSTPSLAQPLVLTRFRPKVALTGLWVAALPQGTLVLRLGRDGRFALGAHSGHWRVETDRLVLSKSKTEVITYRWHLADDVLTLNGGDLDAPLELRKRKG